MDILFSSYHNYLDLASGAAISTRELLLELARRGWNVRIFCGAFFDGANVDKTTFLQSLAVRRITPKIERFCASVAGKQVGFRLVQFNDHGIETTVFLPDDAFVDNRSRILLRRTTDDLFLKLFVKTLGEFKPNVYLTYGGYWSAPYAAEAARRSGAKNVFFLCNLAYRRRELFDKFDAVVVPSEFARTYYREKLGLDAVVLPPLIDETKTSVESNSRRFVTFVNPSLEKGRSFLSGSRVS